jgi:hypothetical protein
LGDQETQDAPEPGADRDGQNRAKFHYCAPAGRVVGTIFKRFLSIIDRSSRNMGYEVSHS